MSVTALIVRIDRLDGRWVWVGDNTVDACIVPAHANSGSSMHAHRRLQFHTFYLFTLSRFSYEPGPWLLFSSLHASQK